MEMGRERELILMHLGWFRASLHCSFAITQTILLGEIDRQKSKIVYVCLSISPQECHSLSYRCLVAHIEAPKSLAWPRQDPSLPASPTASDRHSFSLAERRAYWTINYDPSSREVVGCQNHLTWMPAQNAKRLMKSRIPAIKESR